MNLGFVVPALAGCVVWDGLKPGLQAGGSWEAGARGGVASFDRGGRMAFSFTRFLSTRFTIRRSCCTRGVGRTQRVGVSWASSEPVAQPLQVRKALFHWLGDPEARTGEGLFLERGAYRLVGRWTEGQAVSRLLKGFKVPVRELSGSPATVRNKA